MSQIRWILLPVVLGATVVCQTPPPCGPAIPQGQPCITSALQAVGTQIVDYSNATALRVAAIQALRDKLAKCVNCSDRQQIETQLNQMLKEDAAIRSMEGEALKVLGFPSNVHDFQDLRQWFAAELAEKPDTLNVYVPVDVARTAILGFCNGPYYRSTVGFSQQGDVLRGETLKTCIQDLDPEKVVSNRQAAMTYCFTAHDYYQMGSRKAYDACMNQNDILTALCTIEQQFTRASTRTAGWCAGPDPSNREVSVLRYGGHDSAASHRFVQPFIVQMPEDLNHLQSDAPHTVGVTVLLEIKDGTRIIIPKGAQAFVTVSRAPYEGENAHGTFAAIIKGDYAIVEGNRIPLPTRKQIIRLPFFRRIPPYPIDLWYGDDPAPPSPPGLPASLHTALPRIAQAPNPLAVPSSTSTLSTSAIPYGTRLVILTVEAIDIGGSNAGRSFRAKLEQPVELNGQTIFPAGTDVFLKSRNLGSGGSPNMAHLAVSIDFVQASDGRRIALTTNEFARTVSTSPTSGNQSSRRLTMGGVTIGIPNSRSAPAASLGTIPPQTRMTLIVSATAQ